MKHETNRNAELDRFYGILRRLDQRLDGGRTLSHCHGGMPWPIRGVYFFFEPDEFRSSGDRGLRVVRVGAHALTSSSRSTLWQRLAQHRGTIRPLGGNHRGSIFRLLAGLALLSQDSDRHCPTWGTGSSADRATRLSERDLEAAVSEYIGKMKVLWLTVEDLPGLEGTRGYVERNAIALLSEFDKPPIDAPSSHWLGRHCPRERVRRSGLWNSNHVNEKYEPAFLDRLERLLES